MGTTGHSDKDKQTFTAKEIADVLGVDRRTVQRAFNSVTVDGVKSTRGAIAHAWRVSSFPSGIAEQLETLRGKLHFRSIAALLSNCRQRYELPCPISEIPEEFHQKALKLREALRRPLLEKDTRNGADLYELGLSEYRRVFGHAMSISRNKWDAILNRTLERDGGFEEWGRLEIYFEDEAFQEQKKPKFEWDSWDLHKPLDCYFQIVKDPLNLDPSDRALIFQFSFEHFEHVTQGLEDSRLVKRFKRSLLQYLLFRFRGLSKNESSLKQFFKITFPRWVANGRVPSIFEDQRKFKSGRKFNQRFNADIERIKTAALQHDGNIALAYRRLRKNGELSPDLVDHYHFNPRENKSYVPKPIKDRVKPELSALLPHRRGSWHAKQKEAFISRDWSNVQPGDYFCADDVTWNNYYWHIGEDGQTIVERGECLVMVDIRCDYPVGFLLLSGSGTSKAHYNSRDILSLILQVHDDVGLPRHGFQFEKGVWSSSWIDGKKSKTEITDLRNLIKGLQEYGLGFGQIEETHDQPGLNDRRLGISVRHTLPRNPRSKPIERVFLTLQELQRNQPGFVGFNERTQKMERTQDFIKRARSGKEHPGNELLHRDQWLSMIRKTFDEFANDPQNGKRLPGVSPREMWDTVMHEKTLIRLPAEARWILATNKSICSVQPNGISLKIPGLPGTQYFAGETTNNFIGQKVRVFFNIDYPDLIQFSDLKGESFHSASRQVMHAMDASSEDFKRVKSVLSSHNNPSRKRFGTLNHRVISTISSDSRFTEQDKEFGRFHQEEIAKHKERENSDNRKRAEINKLTRQMGQQFRGPIKDPDLVLQATKKEMEIRERIRLREQAELEQARDDE